MTRRIFLTDVKYLATTLDLILIKVLLTDPGYILRSMSYLHVLPSVWLTYIQTPNVGWYQLVGK